MSKKTGATAPFEADTVWETRYDDNSTRWERGELNPAYLHWQAQGCFDGLGPVIIPGCGRSPEPLAFAGLGARITALDFASTATDFQTKLFARHSLKAHIEQADVLNWKPQTPADAVYDQTCLCALTPSVWQDYASQIQAWLKPGGQAFMLFMQTGKDGGPPFHCSIDAMGALFDTKHWSWPAEPYFRADHSSGKVELGVVLTRR